MDEWWDELHKRASHISEGETGSVGPYSLCRIGQGTFGTILRMSSEDETHALKIKHIDTQFQEREATIMKTLRHPNVMNVLFHRVMDNVEYILMPYVSMDLRRVFRTLLDKGQRMKQHTAVSIMRQILTGIEYIHEQQIMHRDIKPENIMYEPKKGQVKVTDFGAAKKWVEHQPHTTYICTRWYRAPELILDRDLYTPQCDMWSVGCVFAEFCLPGPLFNSARTSAELLARQIKLLGSLQVQDIANMPARTYTPLSIPLPNVPKKPWRRVLCMSTGRRRVYTSYGVPYETLLDSLLMWDPTYRATPSVALRMPYLQNNSNTMPSWESMRMTKDSLDACSSATSSANFSAWSIDSQDQCTTAPTSPK